MSSDTDLSSTWNQAAYYLLRIHEISYNLNEARRNQNFKVWSTELWNYLSELSSQMKEEEIDEVTKKLHTGDKLQEHSYYDKKRFQNYMDAEITLKKIMSKRGLLVQAPFDPKQAIK